MTTRRHFFASTAAFATLPLHGKAPSRMRIGQIGTAHAHAGGKMSSLRGLPDLWQVVGADGCACSASDAVHVAKRIVG